MRSCRFLPAGLIRAIIKGIRKTKNAMKAKEGKKEVDKLNKGHG